MQLSDLEALNHALGLFGEDERGLYLQSSLFDLEIRHRMREPTSHQDAQSAARHIHHDLWCLAVLVSRLTWMQAMSREGNLHPQLWRTYCQLDIEAFMVQVRSIMDYSVIVIDSFASKSGQLPESFRKLRGSIDRYCSKLPDGVEDLVRKADWFDTIRIIRDELVHEGAVPVVFPSELDDFLFQIHTAKGQRLITRHGFMYNENVVHFDRFAAWSMAHALSYLDSLGKLLTEKAKLPPPIGPSRSYSPGFAELHDWMRNLTMFLGRQAGDAVNERASSSSITTNSKS